MGILTENVMFFCIVRISADMKRKFCIHSLLMEVTRKRVILPSACQIGQSSKDAVIINGKWKIRLCDEAALTDALRMRFL